MHDKIFVHLFSEYDADNPETAEGILVFQYFILLKPFQIS